MTKYNTYSKALSLNTETSHLFEDFCFDTIRKDPELSKLTGRQMAKVCALMRAQKDFGYNQCGKEFGCW